MSDSSPAQAGSATALPSASDGGAAPQEPARGPDQGRSFDTVWAAERELIKKLKGASDDAPVIGLALSGGGIRSATFNLGVLQALAREKLVERLDYLSTVSGGGYIGSWLSAWIHRESISAGGAKQALQNVQDALSRTDGGEPRQVAFLREYSNYLTPKTGLFSGDTLAGAATYTRNLLLNLSILILVVSAVLLLVRGVVWLGSSLPPHAALMGTGLLLAMALWFISLNLAYQVNPEGTGGPWFTKRRFVMLLVVAPLAASAVLAGFWLRDDSARNFLDRRWWLLLAAVPAVSVIAWAAGRWIGKRQDIRKPYSIPWRIAGLVAGTLAGIGLLHALQGALHGAAALHVAVWGLPAALGVFVLAVAVTIGITGRQFEEESREWWSRVAGALIGVALAWIALTAAALYGPYWVGELARTAKGLGIAWIVTTAAGVWSARSRYTGTPGTNRWLELLPKVAPYVFVAGLLIALAYALHLVLMTLSDGGAAASGWSSYITAVERTLDWDGLALPLIAILVLTTLLVWRVDINLFSFHMFYRNRLTRCYLGASNANRAKDLYTGLDPRDSVALRDLRQRPYHLVNTALNITSGDRLAWQERQAAAFLASPLYCGYEFAESDRSTVHAYQGTERYVAKDGGHLSLGAALTISGAAASPNMGYHSSPAVAFLMTVFNVRLGWWMQNPCFGKVWERGGPRWGFNYLLAELAGATDHRSRFVYLSDGGHFDNLGLYELVRRRCRFIMACDAGMDVAFGFEDLGNAIRKCKIDLGVTIDLDPRAIIPDRTSGRSAFHCAVGTIRYNDASPGEADGYLLYVKPSLTGNEPTDILQYAKTHAAFPHEPTSDQWFSESQFESYRKLGCHIMRSVLQGAAVDGGQDAESIFVALKERWYPAAPPVNAAFARHTDQLKTLKQALSSNSDLRFLDGQIYPEWGALLDGRKGALPVELSLPADAAQIRAGFYFCSQLLSLMEGVYIDLQLEETHQHPDNRGWLNLFRHWSWATMVRVSYAICCATHGARFQTFCRRHFDLVPGEVRLERPQPPKKLDLLRTEPAALGAWLKELEDRLLLNFEEARIIRDYASKEVPFDELVLLRLGVQDPSQPDDSSASGRALEFSCGFVLANKKQFVFYRVQDHLRRMGLARDGLRALRDEGYIEMAPNVPVDDAESRLRFESLLRSVSIADEPRTS